MLGDHDLATLQNQFVVNPRTGRKIRVGGAVYKRLVADNLLGDNRVKTIASGSDEDLKKIKNSLNPELLPKNTRLKIKDGKLVTARKRVSKRGEKEREREVAINAFMNQKQLMASNLPDSVKCHILNKIIDARMVKIGRAHV